ncbi:metal-dependent hydrolase [bacterium]|nr:metal-dependent hydrolase [bacterium]
MASPIAHSLAGISLYWLSRRNSKIPDIKSIGKREIIGCGIAVFLANMSDFDLIIGWLAERYLHHQVSHTFAFALFFGILAGLIAPAFKVSRWRAFWLTTAIISSHVIIDYFTRDTTTPKGCMLFWPVSNQYFIFPIAVFLDIWRMSPKLIFGYNNLNAAIREIAIGGFFLLSAHQFNKLPKPLNRFILPVTLAFGLLSIGVYKPLMARAEEQLLEFWGPPPVHASSETTSGNRGILFASKQSGNMDIYRIQSDGTDLKQLTIDANEDIWPIWSPDGNWIIFQSNRSGNRDIWFMAADGSGKRNLTKHDSMDESPVWTSTGNQIVFSSDRSGDFGLYVMNRDGSNPKQITPSDKGMKILPAVSPKEDMLVFTGKRPLLPGWHIYRMSLNGGKPERISSEFGCRAKWSPDGEYLAYVSNGSGETTDIFTFRKDGRRRLRLLKTPEYDYDPCFSPDGKQICFARGNESGKGGGNLWIINLDGSGLRPLTTDNKDNRFPCWR